MNISVCTSKILLLKVFFKYFDLARTDVNFSYCIEWICMLFGTQSISLSVEVPQLLISWRLYWCVREETLLAQQLQDPSGSCQGQDVSGPERGGAPPLPGSSWLPTLTLQQGAAGRLSTQRRPSQGLVGKTPPSSSNHTSFLWQTLDYGLYLVL